MKVSRQQHGGTNTKTPKRGRLCGALSLPAILLAAVQGATRWTKLIGSSELSHQRTALIRGGCLLATCEKLLYASPVCAWALPSEWLRMQALAVCPRSRWKRSAADFDGMIASYDRSI